MFVFLGVDCLLLAEDLSGMAMSGLRDSSADQEARNNPLFIRKLKTWLCSGTNSGLGTLKNHDWASRENLKSPKSLRFGVHFSKK